jgi:hypothetical protein
VTPERVIVRAADGWTIEERGQIRRRSARIWATRAEAEAALPTWTFEEISLPDYPQWQVEKQLDQMRWDTPRCLFCSELAGYRMRVVFDEQGRYGTLSICGTKSHTRLELMKSWMKANFPFDNLDDLE